MSDIVETEAPIAEMLLERVSIEDDNDSTEAEMVSTSSFNALTLDWIAETLLDRLASC